MRRWILAFCLIGFASHAVASEFDVPTLRGSSPFIPAAPKYARWAGVYGGAWGGFAGANMNFSHATESLIAYMLRTTALENEQHPSQWGVLGKAHVGGASYGGFVGYNTQWSDAIVGIEFHYNRTNLFTSAPVEPITRVVSAGGNTYLATISGDAAMKITDFGSLRLRGGWATGNFLPYGTIGFGIGRANVSRSASVVGVENPPAGYPGTPCNSSPTCTEFNFSMSDSKDRAFVFGWSWGIGMDMMVMPNLFVRAEFEQINFSEIRGIEARLSTARAGIGLKF